jgi:hypothetical protein
MGEVDGRNKPYCIRAPWKPTHGIGQRTRKFSAVRLSLSADLPSAASPEVWTGGWGHGASVQPFPGKFAFGLEIKAFHPYH